jgi:putative FmdB family regulatory protein
MPFYEYQCKSCGHQLEAMQKINDRPLKKCPDCGKPALERLMSAPVFRLKGGGWYETDFKSEKDGKRNLADQPEAEAPKDDKKETKEDSSKEAAAAKDAGKDAGKDAAKDTAKDTAKPAEKAADKPAAPAPASAESAKSPKSGKRSTRGDKPSAVKPHARKPGKRSQPKPKPKRPR